MTTIFSCIGTRPDIIKMSPILNEISKLENVNSYVCVSGQHKELASEAISELNIKHNAIFNIMKPQQTPDYILSILLNKFSIEMKKVAPDLVLIHGDTTTALAGALSAFYLKIKVFYIEAGLRTYSNVPFPEELHRRLITHCSTFFACPDKVSAQNLISERMNSSNIFITGNTIADVINNSIDKNYEFTNSILAENDFENNKEIIITMHRGETTKEALINICNTLKKVVSSSDNILCFWPVHPNPRIKNVVVENLSNVNNIYLLDPLGVKDMHNLLFRSSLILTDSGGLQEEAFLLEKPTIVLRECTERMEFLNPKLSKLFDPIDITLNNEICEAICHLQAQTDYSIADKLFAKTGASKRIVGYINKVI